MKFRELAAKDLEELKRQVQQEFNDVGRRESLNNYKVDILAEHSCFKEDDGIIVGLIWGKIGRAHV